MKMFNFKNENDAPVEGHIGGREPKISFTCSISTGSFNFDLQVQARPFYAIE